MFRENKSSKIVVAIKARVKQASGRKAGIFKITGAIVDNKSGHFVVTHDCLLKVDLRGVNRTLEKKWEDQRDPYTTGEWAMNERKMFKRKNLNVKFDKPGERIPQKRRGLWQKSAHTCGNTASLFLVIFGSWAELRPVIRLHLQLAL